MPQFSTDDLRSRFASYLESQQIRVNEPFRESLLIQDGYYCGRRFSFNGYQMVWFIEEQQIKLFSPEGELTMTCGVDKFLEPVHQPIRRAA